MTRRRPGGLRVVDAAGALVYMKRVGVPFSLGLSIIGGGRRFKPEQAFQPLDVCEGIGAVWRTNALDESLQPRRQLADLRACQWQYPA